MTKFFKLDLISIQSFENVVNLTLHNIYSNVVVVSPYMLLHLYIFCSAKHSCLENLLQIQFCYSYFGTMIFSFWQKKSRLGNIILNAQNPSKELNYLVLKNIPIHPKSPNRKLELVQHQYHVLLQLNHLVLHLLLASLFFIL